MQRGQPFGVARGEGGDGADDQAVAVLHERVAHGAELGLLARAFAVRPGVRVGRGGMRVIAVLLAAEVLLAIAPRIRRWAGAILRPEALDACPGVEQRAIDREVLRREQGLHPELHQHGGKEACRHLARQQPVAVLGKSRGVPDRVVHTEADKPAEQQVEVYPLNQLALRADQVEGLQQPLGRDRIPARWRIEQVQLSRHLGQSGIDDRADQPQRVVRADPLFQIHVAEQRTPHLILAAHPDLTPSPSIRESRSELGREGEFQQPARLNALCVEHRS